jgi:hypothetical protein
MIDKNKKTIVLMPPKTASNSIRVLLEQFGYVFFKDSKINYPQIHLKLSEIVELYDIRNLDDYKIIQVVRNPYSRFISSYFFQKKIIPDWVDVKFKNFDLNSFSNHLLESKNTDDFVLNFYGNNSFVNDCIQSGKSWGGVRFYDKQVDWNDVGVDVKYFKLEELSKETEQLQSYLNLPNGKLPKVNSQELVFDYFELLTPDVKDIVVKLFEEDFEKFDYNK